MIMNSILKGIDAMLVAISKDYDLDIEELRSKYGTPKKEKVKEKVKCNGMTAKGKACTFNACVGSEMCKKHMKCVVIEEPMMKVPPNTPIPEPVKVPMNFKEELEVLEAEVNELSREEFKDIVDQAETPPSVKKVEMMKQTQAYKKMMEMEEVDD
jgi:hypothetical protein